MSRHGLARVIVASSVGTVIEFYDFFIFASLAATIATHFFPPDRPTFGFLSTLATYGIGLAVRPFGSLAFGRLGDTVGRKTTFLITKTTEMRNGTRHPHAVNAGTPNAVRVVSTMADDPNSPIVGISWM